jgi:hypothetical protein
MISKKSFFIIFILSSFNILYCDDIKNAQDTVVGENLPPERGELPPFKLDSKNFTQMLNVSQFSLVYFSNPMMKGHKNFYKQFSQAHLLSHNVSFFNYKINFGIVDCTLDVELCKKNHVDIFPTMKMFNGTDYRATYDKPVIFYNIINFVYYSFTDEESNHRYDDLSNENNITLHDEL